MEIGQKVQTNIHYCQGWEDCSAPPGIRRIKEAIIVKKESVPKTGKSDGWLYIIKTKSQTKEINGCFLEVIN